MDDGGDTSEVEGVGVLAGGTGKNLGSVGLDVDDVSGRTIIGDEGKFLLNLNRKVSLGSTHRGEKQSLHRIPGRGR